MSKNYQSILTIDLGTTTGWAYRNHESAISHGTINFKSNRFEGGGMRFVRFADWLHEMQTLCKKIDLVYFEEVRRHIGVTAAHTYGGFLNHLTAWAERNEIAYQGVPVGTIKKHITGKGNAGKQMVIDAVRQRGFNPSDDNEADALAILFWKIDKEIM